VGIRANQAFSFSSAVAPPHRSPASPTPGRGWGSAGHEARDLAERKIRMRKGSRHQARGQGERLDHQARRRYDCVEETRQLRELARDRRRRASTAALASDPL